MWSNLQSPGNAAGRNTIYTTTCIVGYAVDRVQRNLLPEHAATLSVVLLVTPPGYFLTLPQPVGDPKLPKRDQKPSEDGSQYAVET